jgi:hypothetical protein
MRKSERIRQLELTIVGMQYELEFLKSALDTLLESINQKGQDLEAGKWYTRKYRDPND